MKLDEAAPSSRLHRRWHRYKCFRLSLIEMLEQAVAFSVLLQHVASLNDNCGSNWTLKNGVCYKVTSQMSWNGAQRFCNTLNGSLANIGSSSQDNDIFEYLGTHKIAAAWIGLNRLQNQSHWLWVSGDAVTYVQWESGEPNNQGGNEYCAEIHYPIINGWYDVHCNGSIPGVCKKTGNCSIGWTVKNESCYMATTSMSWSEVRQACESLNGSIVDIGSNSQESDIYEYLRSLGIYDAWIGLHKLQNHTQWLWDSGNAVEYLNWANGEPNNQGGNEYCVKIAIHKRSGWNDVPCYWSLHGICKKSAAFAISFGSDTWSFACSGTYECNSAYTSVTRTSVLSGGLQCDDASFASMSRDIQTFFNEVCASGWISSTEKTPEYLYEQYNQNISVLNQGCINFTIDSYYVFQVEYYCTSAKTNLTPTSDTISTMLSTSSYTQTDEPSSSISPTSAYTQTDEPSSSISPTSAYTQRDEPSSSISPTLAYTQTDEPSSSISPTSAYTQTDEPSSSISPIDSGLAPPHQNSIVPNLANVISAAVACSAVVAALGVYAYRRRVCFKSRSTSICTTPAAAAPPSDTMMRYATIELSPEAKLPRASFTSDFACYSSLGKAEDRDYMTLSQVTDA